MRANILCLQFSGDGLRDCKTVGAQGFCSSCWNYYKISNMIIQYEKMKELLRWIGYPRRGTDEEYSDIFDAAKDIQANFKLEDLENEI